MITEGAVDATLPAGAVDWAAGVALTILAAQGAVRPVPPARAI